eukprot:262032-Amphidinium_carterae.1
MQWVTSTSQRRYHLHYQTTRSSYNINYFSEDSRGDFAAKGETHIESATLRRRTMTKPGTSNGSRRCILGSFRWRHSSSWARR